ncbi:MAG: DUF3631 domain-containing protein [Nevskia sp.]|nr:DUF3631 domain-containing protein [Nevskia sp.]
MSPENSSSPPPPGVEAPLPDLSEAVSRLSRLPPLEYERVREREAEALGIKRVSVLDAEVKRARGESEDTSAGQPLSFPEMEPWPDPVCGADVLDEIVTLCARFLHLPRHGDTVVALWVALTYVSESFECLPLLFITAPEKGCGKSTVLDLVGRVCNRPLPASNITGAALFRTVEIAKPTLLLDEADSFLRDNEEMRGIIDSGHTRSAAFVIRVVGDNHEPRTFSTWCAKAIAGIGRLPGTIEDRAVILSMQRLAPGERVEKLRHMHQFPDLRRKLARWAGDHVADLRAARPSLPETLHNRAADNWEPLFAIAHAAGGSWAERVAAAVQSLIGAGHVPDSTGTELLRDIRSAFDAEHCDRLYTTRLIERLIADDAAYWAEYDRGKPITGPQIAKLLKRYGIAPGTIRTGDGTAKGYKREQFADAFARYLPASTPQSGFSTVTPSQADTAKASSDFSSRHIGAAVTAAETAETGAVAALLPCDGSRPSNPPQDTAGMCWRVEL